MITDYIDILENHVHRGWNAETALKEKFSNRMLECFCEQVGVSGAEGLGKQNKIKFILYELREVMDYNI